MKKLMAGLIVFVCGCLLILNSQVSTHFLSRKPHIRMEPQRQIDVAAHSQDITVLVYVGDGTGSGTIFTRKDSTGTNDVNLILTAGHVIAALRSEQTIINTNGVMTKRVVFKDAIITKTIVSDGRMVGTFSYYAEVIRYSDADDGGEDLAVLRVRKAFTTNTVVFNNSIPPVGTPVIHVGCLHGTLGIESFSTGVYAYIGRIIYGKVYDQTTAVVFPGSSGGGVYLSDGSYAGMALRMSAPAMNYIIPTRRIVEWAKKTHTEWALNADIPMPDDEHLGPVELNPVVKEAAPTIILNITTENGDSKKPLKSPKESHFLK